MKCFTLLLFAFSGVVKSTENIYMKRSEVDDQEASSSAYAYQLNSGGPLQYTAYPAAQGLHHFGYPAITLGRYTQELPAQLPIAGDYQPQPSPNGHLFNSYGYPAGKVAYGIHPLFQRPIVQQPLQPIDQQEIRPIIQQEIQPVVQPPIQPIQPIHPIIQPIAEVSKESFSKGGGSNYDASKQSSHGEKGSEGYKNVQQYEKGAEGKHGKEGQKEYHNEEGAHKSGHHDAGSHFNNKESEAKGVQGSNFHHSTSHKKGHKTSGFHRVHHKDEYKKDHSFYDESDNGGHFNKYGDFNSKQAAENGAFAKGGHQDSAYQQGESGSKGFIDSGKYNQHDKGYKGQQGQEAHQQNFQEYAKKGEQEQEKQQGFSEHKGIRQ